MTMVLLEQALPEVRRNRWLRGRAIVAALFGGLTLAASAVMATEGQGNAIGVAQAGGTRSPCGWAAGHTLGGVGGPVYALKSYHPEEGLSPDILCVAGEFATAGGLVVNNVAIWDGASWSAMGGAYGVGTNGPVYSLGLLANLAFDYLAVGGAFTTVGGFTSGEIAIWYGGEWQTWGDTDGEVYALFSPIGIEDDLYAGGYFTVVDGVSVGSIAHCCWSSLDGGVDWAVYAIDLFNQYPLQGVYVGGSFYQAGGVYASSIARWDGTAWSPLSGPSANGVSGEVYALEVMGDDLYAGGWFGDAGGLAAGNVARWDGTQWWPLSGPAANGTDAWVGALEWMYGRSQNGLYAGGGFTTAGGVVTNHVASWDGSGWSALTGPYGTGVDGNVNALEWYDDGTGEALYVGGSFTTAGGLPSQNLAKWVCEGLPPSDPTALASTSHAPGTWSHDWVVDLSWSGAGDSGGSGVAGYSLLFDQLPSTLPDGTLEVLHVGDPNLYASTALADGDSHYVHLLTRDGSGNSSPALHLGPFWVDSTPPGEVVVGSSSHQPGEPSGNQTIDFFWLPPADSLSGVDGYALELSTTVSWTCDQVKDEEEGVTSLTTEPLSAGSWYLHICAVDNAGNWSGATSAGPFEVVPGLIFTDGFESGDTSAWSVTVP